MFFRPLLAIATGLMVATPALSQSGDEGPSSITETFQDWVVQCSSEVADGDAVRACQMSQELSRSSDGQRVLNMALQRNSDGTPVLRLVTPLGVVLAQGVGVEAAEQELVRFGFQTCLPSGCIAQGPLEPSDMDELRGGAEAQVTMLGVNGDNVSLTISLMGFSAAWERLAELSG